MTMESGLPQLPVELIDVTLEYLELHDICNLRLTSQQLRAKSTRHKFTDHFKTRRVELSQKSLEVLIAVANHPDFGPAVQDLTILAVVYDGYAYGHLLSEKLGKTGFKDSDDEAESVAAKQHERMMHIEQEQRDLQKTDRLTRLLSTAFHKIERLRSISLDAIYYEDFGTALPAVHTHNWKSVWQQANYTFIATCEALATSGLTVQNLDIFTRLSRCSIETRSLFSASQKMREAGALSLCLHDVRRFAASWSNRITQAAHTDNYHLMEHHHTPAARAAREEEDFTGPALILSCMSHLEELDLHQYRVPQGHGDGYEAVFKEIAARCNFEYLTRCTLKGLRVTEESFVTLLEKAPRLRCLDLRDLRMVEGLWGPIFTLLSSSSPSRAHPLIQLQSLTVLRLWDRRLLRFAKVDFHPFRAAVFDAMDLSREGGIEYTEEGVGVVPPHEENYKNMLQYRCEYGPPTAYSLRAEQARIDWT